MKNSKRLLAAAVSTALGMPIAAHATNGMNLEGYGPIATGMGGASMAYDNGTAAMMNNPATLGLMESDSRLDVAVGVLGPDVNSQAPEAMGGFKADSGGDSYTMPAVGWAKNIDRYTYGVGVFAQGGMGTEYESDSWLAARTGQDVRSEIGVGRVMAPLAFSVNERLKIGGSIDYVWGGLDMKMVMPVMNPMTGTATPGTFADFLPSFGGSNVLGEAALTPNLAGAMQDFVQNQGYDTVGLNFSNGSDFTQEAKGAGFGGKIGAVYQATQEWSFGGAYHLKTAMSDWEGNAEMVFYDTDGTNPDAAMKGDIKVKDFQWPATLAVGTAYKKDKFMLAADVKVLYWSEVMKDFSMTFTPDAMPGESADIVFYQEWDDQTVISLGGAYQVSDAFTVRAGANISDNPIPDDYVHPMFPAIVENHYTAGFGYGFNKVSSVDFSATYAPEVSATNSNTGAKITHSQTNWQLMYSHRF